MVETNYCLKKRTMIIYNTIKKYSEIFNSKTLHPLINLVDLNKSNELPRTKFTMNFYAIVIKDKVFDGEKTINEIAYELGFKYPQHFSRLFKQRVGVTPNEYKHLN